MAHDGASQDSRWESLHDQRIELALLQVDIVSHGSMPGTEADKLTMKIRFLDTFKDIATAHGGRPFNLAGDGGSFMFLTGGDGFNELVTAALEIRDAIPQLNKKILSETGLKSPVRVRISCHAGLAIYRKNPSEISGDFINSFLKHERSVSEPDTVCITESVHQQLNATLQDQFRWKKRSAELGCAIYELSGAAQVDVSERKRPCSFPGWTLLVAPLLGIVITVFLPMHPLLVALVVLLVILVNVLISWQRSKCDSTEDQNFFRSLVKDDLLALESGRPLVFQAKIVIVEDTTQKSSFIKSVEQDFKRANESKESNLILIPFTCDGSAPEDQRQLRLTLEGANAVVVVWTKALRDKAWVYKTIDSWAFKRSDVPILFAIADRTIPEPEGFLHIPADSKTLPWRLLQRGNERARDWRGVAGFNRLMVGNVLIMFLMIIVIGGVLVQRHKASTYAASGDMFRGLAYDLKKQFLNTIVVHRDVQKANTLGDQDLHVSLWFSECGEARQFASTESGQAYMTFDLNKKSVIGATYTCGTGACVSKGGLNLPLETWNIADEKVEDDSAKMHEEGNKNRQLVTCATHGPDPPNARSTVGVCVFSDKDYVTVDQGTYRNTLRARTKELFDRVSPHLANGAVTALPEQSGFPKLRRLYRCLLY